jgi:hypothetical protein
MKLTRADEIIAPLAVYEALKSLPRGPRRAIEDFLLRVTRQPHLPGDFEAAAAMVSASGQARRRLARFLLA